MKASQKSEIENSGGSTELKTNHKNTIFNLLEKKRTLPIEKSKPEKKRLLKNQRKRKELTREKERKLKPEGEKGRKKRMVLWEITLGTAYFLGLKRTYKLALKIQRRIIGPKHPRIRQFVQRRTRAVFDVALKVHQNIQRRDIEVGRNLGNWILRWLDKMKPSAQIRGSPHQKPHHYSSNANMNTPKQMTNTSSSKTPSSNQTPRNREADRQFFSSTTNTWPKSFPTIAMMIRPPRAAGNMTQYRHISISGLDTLRLNNARGEGVIRKDIMQWMLYK